ncbi:helix-turn-helix domain-containing protein [Rhodopirellula islandica]|uniref:helix-turn-helix domain-containing protein n=1 Tax=Rhodopirellula islandica TaxID=595434 RepID=UPI001F26D0F2|nr:helix-turn-helix domain-containing protein [Rhodopirellula islandica]
MTRSSRPSRPKSLIKQLDASTARVWIIDAAGELIHLSPTMAKWLGNSNETDDSQAVETLPEHWVDALRPDPSIRFRCHQTRRITLTQAGNHAPNRGQGSGSHSDEALTAVAHWVSLGTSGYTLGCLGEFLRDSDVPLADWLGEGGLRQESQLRELIAKHRSSNARTADILLAGESDAAELLRRRVTAATSMRCHLGLFTITNASSRELALWLHDASTPEESLTIVDGALMDAELLEAYAAPAIHSINRSESGRGDATLLIERLDEMPDDAQLKLSQWVEVFGDHLRLIGLLDPARVMETQKQTNPTVDPLDAQIAELTHVPQAVTGIAKPLLNLMCAMPITIPRLQDRREDIPALALALLHEAHRSNQSRKQSTKTEMPRLGRDALDALTLYPWPNDFDELAEAMTSALGRVVGERIGREHLPLVIRSYRVGPNVTSEKKSDPDNNDSNFRIHSLDEAVQKYERELIDRAINAAQGNKAEAARRLGISRARLLRKLDG